MNPLSVLPARLRSPAAVCVAISALAIGGLLGLRYTGALQPFELIAYDWTLRWRPVGAAAAPPIAIVAVSEEDIRGQRQWPISDATLARALDALDRLGARAIGLDIYRDAPVPPGREALDAALLGNPRVIAVMKFGTEPRAGVPPPPVLKGTAQVAISDLIPDPDGVVRRALLFLDDGQSSYPALALRLALLYLQEEGILPQPDPVQPDHLRLGEATLRPLEPTDGGYVRLDARGYQILPDFRTPPSTFPIWSLTDLLSGRIPAEAVKAKIVLVGTIAESVPDYFYTPLSTQLLHAGPVRGVLLHAQIASQLIRAAQEGVGPIRTLPTTAEVVWIAVWGLMGGVVGTWVRSPWRLSAGVVVGLAVLGVLGVAGLTGGWWVPTVPPALAWILAAGAVTAHAAYHERRERALLMQLFSRHVSPEVADAAWQHREEFLCGGRPRPQALTVTVLFTDFRGYTSVSEKMSPEELMAWLNTYMEALASQVAMHGGHVDNFIGDAIKADFGVPLPRTTEEEIARDARNAVSCAIAMARELERLNQLVERRGLPTVGMRIGIYTGPVVAGSLGSAEHMKYTTIGDTVNTAARLESLGKELPGAAASRASCSILIGESTRRHLGDGFRTEMVGEVSVKGKAQKILVHQVLGAAGGSDGTRKEGQS
jgi:adenylate cyclase